MKTGLSYSYTVSSLHSHETWLEHVQTYLLVRAHSFTIGGTTGNSTIVTISEDFSLSFTTSYSSYFPFYWLSASQFLSVKDLQ